jgi:hypothetical protein
MHVLSAAAAILALAGPPPPAAEAPAGPRFAGLERVYFERTDDPGRGSPRAVAVRRLLPERLPPGGGPKPRAEDDMLSVDDRPLPLPGGRPVILRQVHDANQRIADQWWCLYEDGRRADCWFFAPHPERTDSKLLAEYRVEEVLAPQPDRIVLRTCGTMVRPFGAWWEHGKDFVFVVSGRALRLDHVVGRYYVTRGYDQGEVSPLYVSAEAPRADTDLLETRVLNDVTEAEMKACGYVDPAVAAEDADTLTCAGMERAARCLAASPRAEVRTRRRDEPSFIERGGTAPARPR